LKIRTITEQRQELSSCFSRKTAGRPLVRKSALGSYLGEAKADNKKRDRTETNQIKPNLTQLKPTQLKRTKPEQQNITQNDDNRT
jgi:hypothetical protein